MRKSTLLLSVALASSAAATAWLWRSLHIERERNAELALQVAGLQSGIESDARDAAVSLERTAPAPMAALTAAAEPDSAVATLSTTAPKETNARDWSAYQRQLMLNPKYQEARREQQRLIMATRRANLIRLLGFTPEQADAVIEVNIDERFWQDGNPEGPMTPEALKAARARYDAFEREQQDKLRSLLGDEKRERLQTYMESRPSRMQVDNLRSDLTGADALREDQVEPLITALHAERSQMEAELRDYRESLDWNSNPESADLGRRYSDRALELLKAANTRMLASASSILSNTQLDALEEQLQRTVAQHEAERRLHRLQTQFKQSNRSDSTPN